MTKLTYSFRRVQFTKEFRRLPLSIKLASLAIFAYDFGWGIVMPFFPLYLASILDNYTAVGFVTGLLHLFSFFWAILIGGMLDKVSKRRMISLALLLYLPFSKILFAVKTLSHFVFFRIYHSALATTLWLSNEAYVRSHSRRGEEAESIGLFDASFGLALVIGGIVGAFLMTHFGFSILYSISLFAFFALIVSFFLPDHGKPLLSSMEKVSISAIRKEFRDFFRDTPLVKLVVISFLIAFSSSFTLMVLPLFLNEMGADYLAIGIIAALFYVPVLFEPYFTTFKRKEGIVLLALLLASALFLAMFFAKSIFLIFLISFILGIALSAVHPNIQGAITRSMPKGEKGELSAVVYAAASVASGLGPLFAGLISDIFSLSHVFLAGAMIFSFLAIYYRKIIQKK